MQISHSPPIDDFKGYRIFCQRKVITEYTLYTLFKKIPRTEQLVVKRLGNLGQELHWCKLVVALAQISLIVEAVVVSARWLNTLLSQLLGWGKIFVSKLGATH